jgi:hypothetical protein
MRVHRTKNSLAVGKVSEWALLVDDVDDSLLRADAHVLDIVRRLAERLEPLVHKVCGLDGRLRVELGRVLIQSKSHGAVRFYSSFSAN